MHIFNAIVFLTALISLSFGHPAKTAFNALDEYSNCPAGTRFQNCGINGFYGCCSKDACSPQGCPDAATTPIATPFPTSSPSHVPNPATPRCTPGRKYQPTMNTIYPNNPDFADGNISAISVARNTSFGSFRQQVAIFTGIPTTAKSCGLFWSSSITSHFTVNGSGLVSVTAIRGLLPEKVTWNSIQKTFGKSAGQADFTQWTGPENAKDHTIAGYVDCAVEMVFKIGIADGNVGDVELEQTRQSGLYVEYEC